MLAVHTRAFLRRAIYSQEIAFLPLSNCIFILALRTRAKFDRIFFASIVRTVYRAIRQPFPPRNSKQRSTRHAYQRFSTRFPRRNTGRVLIRIGKRRLARNRRRFRRCGSYAFHLFHWSEATSPRFTGRGFRRQFKKRRLSRASTIFAVERQPQAKCRLL